MISSRTSVIIPTFKRTEQLRGTLTFLGQCNPQPGEILVHVDAGDEETPQMLASKFPEVIVLQSTERQGAGGGRNKLYRAASHDCLVSLDDDSWPLDTLFFSKAEKLIEGNSQVATFACDILESDGKVTEFPSPTPQPEATNSLRPASNFVGCAAILRRSAVLATRGYIRTHLFHGLEETDISLQLLDAGWNLRAVDHLQVFHACERVSHHAKPSINAGEIRNVALLAWLRYPLRFYPYASMQLLNRIRFSLSQKRFRGILSGLASILPACWKYRRERQPVSVATIRKFRELRKQETER